MLTTFSRLRLILSTVTNVTRNCSRIVDLCPEFEDHFRFYLLKNIFTMKQMLFMLWMGVIACTPQSGPAQQVIDAAQTEALLKTDANIQLVDLRTPAELQQTGKIEGAKVINFNSPDFQAQIAELDKAKPVIVYCAAGGRSPRAAAQMTKMGFKKVYDYAGGMNDWLAKGKKTVK